MCQWPDTHLIELPARACSTLDRCAQRNDTLCVGWVSSAPYFGVRARSRAGGGLGGKIRVLGGALGRLGAPYQMNQMTRTLDMLVCSSGSSVSLYRRHSQHCLLPRAG